MSQVGQYRGQWYVRLRHGTVFPYMVKPLKSKWWFTSDNNGKVTGDHFKTLKELKNSVDKTCTAGS